MCKSGFIQVHKTAQRIPPTCSVDVTVHSTILQVLFRASDRVSRPSVMVSIGDGLASPDQHLCGDWLFWGEWRASAFRACAQGVFAARMCSSSEGAPNAAISLSSARGRCGGNGRGVDQGCGSFRPTERRDCRPPGAVAGIHLLRAAARSFGVPVFSSLGQGLGRAVTLGCVRSIHILRAAARSFGVH